MNNIVPFTTNKAFHLQQSDLEAALFLGRHAPIEATQSKSVGFVDPVFHDSGVAQSQEPGTDIAERKFVRRCGDALVFAFKVEKKSVPSAILKQELKVRAEAFQKEAGVPPGRKWAKEMKEEVTQTLLPKCFPTSSEVTAYIDLKNFLLVVGTANLSVAEDIASLLRKALPELEPKFVDVEVTTGTLMSTWVREEPPAGFTVDMDGEMKNAGGGIIRFVKQSMTDKEVCSHLAAGYTVSKLAMTWDEAISFVATREFVLTKLSWLQSGMDERAEDPDAEFVAQMTMESGTLARLIADMVAACGGHRGANDAVAAQP